MYRTPSWRAMVFASLVVDLNVMEDVRDVTRRARTLERSAVTSAVRPSAKYSFSAFALKFVNGRTAIDLAQPAAGALRSLPPADGAAPRPRPCWRQTSI